MENYSFAPNICLVLQDKKKKILEGWKSKTDDQKNTSTYQKVSENYKMILYWFTKKIETPK